MGNDYDAPAENSVCYIDGCTKIGPLVVRYEEETYYLCSEHLTQAVSDPTMLLLRDLYDAAVETMARALMERVKTIDARARRVS